MVAVQANFIPPAPVPRTRPPSMLEMMRIIYRNPLELWGEPSYNEPWISVFGRRRAAGDRQRYRASSGYILVDNARNYKLATVRQKVLRPILRDGLLTAEGAVWKRSRKAMAPVFAPRRIYVSPHRCWGARWNSRRATRGGRHVDIAHDMTLLTFDILAETLFSGEISGEPGSFAARSTGCSRPWGASIRSTFCARPNGCRGSPHFRGRKTMAFSARSSPTRSRCA